MPQVFNEFINGGDAMQHLKLQNIKAIVADTTAIVSALHHALPKRKTSTPSPKVGGGGKGKPLANDGTVSVFLLVSCFVLELEYSGVSSGRPALRTASCCSCTYFNHGQEVNTGSQGKQRSKLRLASVLFKSHEVHAFGRKRP